MLCLSENYGMWENEITNLGMEIDWKRNRIDVSGSKLVG
jgi:hypothetical protein